MESPRGRIGFIWSAKTGRRVFGFHRLMAGAGEDRQRGIAWEACVGIRSPAAPEDAASSGLDSMGMTTRAAQAGPSLVCGFGADSFTSH